MTDKEQIIIDGCNVSGCVQFTQEGDCCNLGGGCKGWPNCYYKQLKRKEQECEEHRSNAESYCKSYQYSCVVNGKITNKALKYKQALDEIAAHYQKVIKNITTYDNSYDASISIEALHNISGIINKAKKQE